MNAYSPNPFSSEQMKFSRILRQLLRFALAATVMSLPAMAIPAETVLKNTVTQHGITWTFDKPYPVGQYCNGDYFVLGPIVLTGPVSEIITEPTQGKTGGINGTMINPVHVANPPNGFDFRIQGSYYNMYGPYQAALNKGLEMPLAVAAGSSIISCKSAPSLRLRLQLEDMAVLTVVDTVPPAGSFRPTFFGSGNKAATHNKSQIDLTKLKKLPLVVGANLAYAEALLERPMLDLGTTFQSNYLMANNNCPITGKNYGREITLGIAIVGLELNLNYTDAQKELMAIRMVQQGLDYYAGVLLGQKFRAAGGHQAGRKLGMAMAGLLLNDAAILDRLDPVKYPGTFAEDTQHFYVTQQDIDTPRYVSTSQPALPYPQEALGMPEWGPDGGYPKNTAGYNWDRAYRGVVGANCVAEALAARLSGLMTAWKHPAFFDYHDRYYERKKDTSREAINEIKPFVKAMWEAYRSSVSDQNPDAPADAPPEITGLWVRPDAGE
jgi:hypothetical protein